MTEFARAAEVVSAAACGAAAVRTLRGGRMPFAGRERPGMPGGVVAAVVARLGRSVAGCASIRRSDLDEGTAQRIVLAGPIMAVRWSGYSGGDSVVEIGDRLAGLRVLAGATGFAVAVVMVAAIGPSGAPLAVAAGFAIAAMADCPILVAARRARIEIEAALPVTVELLSGMLTAGVGLDAALRMSGAPSSPALRRVVERVAHRVGTGVAPSGAFRTEAEATGVVGLAQLAATVERSAALGIPFEPSLSALAADLASRLHVVHSARAGRNGPLASLVTALVIAPACIGILLVLAAGGFVLSASSGGPG